MLDTILEEDHPKIISAKFEIGSVVSEEKSFFNFHPPFFLMMSFLTYINGFFMNFELLPMLTDYAN
jgi:hypothetical protein